jgi:hypothetical protein
MPNGSTRDNEQGTGHKVHAGRLKARPESP